MRVSLRVAGLLEVILLASFAAWFIWRLQFTHANTWLAFPAGLGASFLLHGDTPKSLGWRADNLVSSMRRAAYVFGVLSAALVLSGLLLGAFSRPAPQLLSLRRLWAYLAFCLLQQVALQSFIVNRLLGVFPSRGAVAVLAGAIFAALHWPNPVLVPLTLIGGTAMAYLFAVDRNIIPLAAGQSILGSLVWWAFPAAWHHLLRVGPAYYWPYRP
jgi:hypothetical protein